LFFPAAQSSWVRTLPGGEKPHNIARRAILDAHDMVIVRSHSNWDGTPGGIMDACAETLGFTEHAHKGSHCCSYRIRPTTLAELAHRAKLRLGVPQVRVAGDPAMTVEIVTVHYGGLAQQFHAVDEAVIAGADAIICGEALDYSFRAAVDAGLGFIETSHINSENPGMRKFARLIAERLPEMPVRFIDAGMPWVYF
ncbi:MAG: Nif3-like dinuclear metal center hexameric protein, partial [Armatimonadetes bacterium]|nr:Nif3-like dinuclear metal center hexameric protein [Armatimonadota bacterium]